MIGYDNPNQVFIEDKDDIEDKRLSLAEQTRMDYVATFSEDRGKRVLKDLSKFALVDDVCFSVDPYRTAFALGARSVVLKIREMMAKEPEEIKRAIQTDNGGTL